MRHLIISTRFRLIPVFHFQKKPRTFVRMKNYLVLLLTLLSYSWAYGYGDVEIKHDLSIITSVRSQKTICYESTKYRSQYSKCLSKVYSHASKDFRNPIVASTYRNLAFLYDEVSLIDEMGDTKKISREIQEIKYRLLMNKIDEELEYGLSKLNVFLADTDKLREEERSKELTLWSLRVLGDTLKSLSRPTTAASQHQVYMIDGKTVICITTGPHTTCQ